MPGKILDKIVYKILSKEMSKAKKYSLAYEKKVNFFLNELATHKNCLPSEDYLHGKIAELNTDISNLSAVMANLFAFSAVAATSVTFCYNLSQGSLALANDLAIQISNNLYFIVVVLAILFSVTIINNLRRQYKIIIYEAMLTAHKKYVDKDGSGSSLDFPALASDHNGGTEDFGDTDEMPENGNSILAGTITEGIAEISESEMQRVVQPPLEEEVSNIK